MFSRIYVLTLNDLENLKPLDLKTTQLLTAQHRSRAGAHAAVVVLPLVKMEEWCAAEAGPRLTSPRAFSCRPVTVPTTGVSPPLKKTGQTNTAFYFLTSVSRLQATEVCKPKIFTRKED